MRALTIAIAGVLAVVVLLLVFGLPANFLVGRLQSRVETDTGYRLRIDGGATVRFWPSPTVVLRNLSVLGPDDSSPRFTVASTRIALSLSDLVRGRVHIGQLTLSQPTLRLVLKRTPRPTAVAAPSASGAEGAKQSVAIDHIVVQGGAISFSNSADHVQNSIDRIDLDASLAGADGRPSMTGTAYWGGHLLQVGLKSQPWPQGMKGRTVPVELTLQAPGLLAQPLSASAEMRVRDSALAVNAIAGRIGSNSFDGSIVVDFASGKPSLRGAFAFDRLQVLPAAAHSDPPQTPANPARTNALSEPWSDREVRLDGLNYFDADLKLSAVEFDVGSFRFAPIAVDASIKHGVLDINLKHVGLYGGTMDGTMSLDASGSKPKQSMRIHLEGVSALPLLSDTAGFQSLEGSLQANVDVSAAGASQRSALSSLNGTMDLHLSNGAVRGIDLAKVMHNLTSTILNGWQQNPADRTPLTDFSAHFRLIDGLATTNDLTLSGPVVRMTGGGSVDIPGRTLQLKVNPQLVVADQGSGNTADATGLGVPVDISGDWAAPRIYPDVDGILNNPDSVYNQLKAAGKGLFGGSEQSGGGEQSGGSPTINNLLQGLGNMLSPSTGRGASGNGQ